MSLIDTRVTITHETHPSLGRRLQRRLGKFITWLCERDEAPLDPTAHFSAHEWADLPTHHPASDEE